MGYFLGSGLDFGEMCVYNGLDFAEICVYNQCKHLCVIHSRACTKHVSARVHKTRIFKRAQNTYLRACTNTYLRACTKHVSERVHKTRICICEYYAGVYMYA